MQSSKACAHCGKAMGTARWYVKPCAAEGKKHYKKLCDKCDCKLNRLVLEFFKFENVEERMREYKNE